MRIRLFLCMLLIATLSYADDAKIIIKQKSGTKTIFEFSTNPVITFEDEEMVITNDFTKLSIPLDDIDYYTADNGTATDIAPTMTNPQIMNGRIIFSGISDRTPIYVYSFDGRMVSKQEADFYGKAEVSLSSLPKGAYIICVQNSKIKVINK